jgi:hypothetical protein
MFRNIAVETNTRVLQAYNFLVYNVRFRISRICSAESLRFFYDSDYVSVAVFRTMPSQYRINFDRQSISLLSPPGSSRLDFCKVLQMFIFFVFGVGALSGDRMGLASIRNLRLLHTRTVLPVMILHLSRVKIFINSL